MSYLLVLGEDGHEVAAGESSETRRAGKVHCDLAHGQKPGTTLPAPLRSYSIFIIRP